jgi:integrase
MGNATAPTRRRRSPGEGSVYRNGNRWRGALTWTNPDGSRERRLVSGATAVDARRKLDELRQHQQRGPVPSARLTVADYLAQWIERDRQNVRPSTWRSRESHVRVYLIPALGRLPLSKLTPGDVERALSGFQKVGRPVYGKSSRGRPQRPVSAQTARHIRATLRRALTIAMRDRLVTHNAAQESIPPRVEGRDVVYLAPDLVRRLIDRTTEVELGPLYALAASTGLRLGELLGLSWESIDLDHGVLTVRQSLARDGDGGWEVARPKSDRARRTIPLPAIAKAALLEQRNRQDAVRAAAGDVWQDTRGLVFTDAVGRSLDPHRVSAQFQRDREAAGVPRVRFHDLRHSAATLLLAQGVPLAVISEWLGHAGIAITMQHYAAIVPQLRIEAAAAMDRALASGQ